MNDTSQPRKRTGNEEPELGAEESVPLDGKDPVGEQMMEDLGRERRKEDPQRRPGSGTQPDEAREAAAQKERGADPGPMPEQLPVS